MIWKEFWNDKDSDQVNYKKEQIFKTIKDNFPRNYKVTNSLKAFLCSVKSDIIDPLGRKCVKSNLSKEENDALNELVKLQKERKIIIKPCDKGVGLIILDFNEYIKPCNKHLSMKQETIGQHQEYYDKIDKTTFNKAANKIIDTIDESFDNEIIDTEEHKAMAPEGKPPGKFYCTFKVNKVSCEGKMPTVRHIISGSGSLKENIGTYAEHHLKKLANTHYTYLRDAPDFVCHIENINSKETLPANAIMVTVDVSALYTNIPRSEGLQYCREELNERGNKDIPTEYLVRLL